ncbi:MAG: SUMF1/EgtB/PvdO family nonheme iron enzyme [Bacteroidaceae bacterium]|nr:SUMF1/EgtB/PvdO family nonheme iron enzyme [Bacteroidaceae bacterium]
MEYPSITEYRDAIQYPESFDSKELQCLCPVKNGSEPVMTSGNFAVVFKMQNPQTGEMFALKCFTQDQDGRAEAYRQIETELRYVDSPYFISLHYVDKGIWAGDYDSAFPVLLMPWVDGEPLDRHIAALVKTDPKRLHLVAYKFSVMASWLVNQPFAHGDIKPDNILVRADGSMVLVDYDGLFVPSMLGTPSREAGTPAFRHPNRPTMPFYERIDDFPLASINLSLYLIALQPELLQKYGAKDRLLFTETDYQNLSQCKLLKEILALCHDAQLQRLYALFFIALSEGSLERCENRLMLLRPPHQDFGILRQPYANPVPVEDVEVIEAVVPQQDLDFNVNGVQFRMKYVEGGTFMMGAPDDDDEADDVEKPAHKVTLDSYYIAETQVTQELWQAVMGSNPSHFKGDIHRPVETVSWNDCKEFVKKLINLIGKPFSLPTEAQWEYAARGGKKSQGYRFSGSNNLADVAWFYDNSNSTTHPVAQKQPNELGLYDMTGNVCEWCDDCLVPYIRIDQTNPQVLGYDSHVLRGGSWCTCLWCHRVYGRLLGLFDDRDEDNGLRLCLKV